MERDSNGDSSMSGEIHRSVEGLSDFNEIDSSGFGVVHTAYAEIHQQVVVKILPADGSSGRRRIQTVIQDNCRPLGANVVPNDVAICKATRRKRRLPNIVHQ